MQLLKKHNTPKTKSWHGIGNTPIRFFPTHTVDKLTYVRYAIKTVFPSTHLECCHSVQDMKNSDVELSDTVYSAILKLLGQKGDYSEAKRTALSWKELCITYCWWFRNPKQPPFGCIKPFWILGYLLHQLVQNFFHQQYVSNMFIPIWGNHPIWLIFFKWVGSTTN